MNENRTGLLLAIAGFATLSVGDAMVKSMAGMWPAIAAACQWGLPGDIFADFLLRDLCHAAG